MASTTECQLIIAKLGEIAALLGELKANQGINATAITENVSNTIKAIMEGLKTKEKRKVTTGESKEASHAPQKKCHPTLKLVSEKAWELDSKGATDFEKRTKWFISVMNKYPEVMLELLGEELIKAVQESEAYSVNIAGKKNDSNTKAIAFFKSIKAYMVKKDEAKWQEVSKRLVDRYNVEKLNYDATGLPQAKPESAGTAESSAAAALAASGLGVSTTSPAAQLAGV